MGLDPDGVLESSRGWREWGRHPIINGYASARARLIDAKFTYRLGIHTTPVGRALKYPAIGLERVSRSFQSAHQDLIFRRYTRLHGPHYGPTGRGHQTIAGVSHDDHLARYQGQISRLAVFVDEHMVESERSRAVIFSRKN